MNEQIKELLEQCQIETYGVNGELLEIGIDAEKFAELIIQECAKKGFDIFDEEPDAPASDLQFYVRDRILQHFGVEE